MTKRTTVTKSRVRPISEAKAYEVIRRPLMTEKIGLMGEYNTHAFEVGSDATKHDVKKAIEKLFGVQVEKVTTLTRKGRVRRFKGRTGMTSNSKRAFVRVKAGVVFDPLGKLNA